MRFDTKYPLLMKIGWIALFAMPILMLATLILFEGSPNEKLFLLSWFILGTLIVAGSFMPISNTSSNLRKANRPPMQGK